MAERRARFAFEMDKKITVTNKRALARLASRQIYDSLSYSHRSLAKLGESINWLQRLNEAEDRLLNLNLFEDTGEAVAEQHLRGQALEALLAARKAMEAVFKRKSDVATQMENDFDPLFKEEKKPKIKPKAVQPPTPVAEPVKVAPAVATSSTPVAPPPAPEQKAAPLVFDPALLARARREMRALAKEDTENELSGSSLGTDD